MSGDVVCGSPIVRTITLQDGCSKECERRYMFYLPNAVCEKPSSIGTLPLVFSIHCLGCNVETLKFWSEIAEEYNFVWVNPEGLQRSFNAGDEACCGYALEEGIDDLGFLQGILNEVSTEYSSVVSKDVAFAMGWSNGGYMVSYAAPLFRAIAPISGYQLDIDKLQKRMDHPVSLFLHHSQDDNFVQMTGCCTDSSMPHCCCGISDRKDQCTSAEAQAGIWATQFNQCGSRTSVSYSVEDKVECHTYTDCPNQLNTTFCIHQHTAHFNRPSVQTAFPMHRDIADFFARDACSINGGIWDGDTRTCTCPSGATWIYCLGGAHVAEWSGVHVPVAEASSVTAESATSIPLLGLALLFLFGLLGVSFIYRQRRKASSPMRQYSKVATNDVELRRI